LNLPLETITSAISAKPANFNMIHFRDAAHDKKAAAHFWVTISVGDNQHMLLSIITSQMSKLEKRYIAEGEEKALDSLVPLSNSDFKELAKPCVINCNETTLLSTKQLIDRIDTAYCSAKSKNCVDFIHYDKDFNFELKIRIIQAINDSPNIRPEVKENIAKIQKILYDNDS
jgi:hypothetical protein